MTNDRSRAAQRRYDRTRDQYLRHALGSTRARPRIIAEYHGPIGWLPSRRGRLDDATAEQMRADGVTLVRVRHRWFRTKEITLRRYVR